MLKKGGKIVGLTKEGAEVDVFDPTATQWFDTNKYKTLTKEQAASMSRPSTPTGARRRKTRKPRKPSKGKKSRRTTRKR
jgi:hypothetical protein